MSPEQKQRERAFEIIEAYGADQTRWPAAERSAIVECIASTPELQRHSEAQAALDRLLGQSEVTAHLDPRELANRIALVPQRLGLSQRLQIQFERLAESMTAAMWRPVAVASIVFVVGVGAGNIALEPVEDWTQAEQSGFVLIGEDVTVRSSADES